MRATIGACAVGLLLAWMIESPDARGTSSVLVYSCGRGFANLCQIGADGRGLKRLTTDGSPNVYARMYNSPSLSRDGERLAYLRGYQLYVLGRRTGHRIGPIANNAILARISPEGSMVGDLEQFAAPSGMGWVRNVCVWGSDGSGPTSGRNCVGTTGSFAFANDDAVLASVSYQYDPTVARYETGICVLNPVTSGCDRFIATDVGHDLTDPSVSPSGTLLALTRAVPGHGEGAIALYDFSSGKLVRQLTNGATDAGPAWSPDGSRVAFVRDSDTWSPRIYTVAATGGKAHLLVAHGRGVTWGQ